jgi:CheY-like chemotaxis protein
MAASAMLLVDMDVAYDGPAAVELSRRQPYRPASLDYEMQGMDGVELCGHLKPAHADTVGVPVTASSAAATSTRQAGPASGRSLRSRWSSVA